MVIWVEKSQHIIGIYVNYGDVLRFHLTILLMLIYHNTSPQFWGNWGDVLRFSSL